MTLIGCQVTERTLRRSRRPSRWRITSSNKWSTRGWKHRYVLHCEETSCESDPSCSPTGGSSPAARDDPVGYSRCSLMERLCLCCRWRFFLRGRRPSSSSSSSTTGTRTFDKNPASEETLTCLKSDRIWYRKTFFLYAFICMYIFVRYRADRAHFSLFLNW